MSALCKCKWNIETAVVMSDMTVSFCSHTRYAFFPNLLMFLMFCHLFVWYTVKYLELDGQNACFRCGVYTVSGV